MGAPALEDENTALLYTHSVRQTRVWALVMAFTLACLAGVLVVWLVVPELPAGFWSAGATVAMVTAALAWLMSPLAATRGPTWRLATRRLLAEQPWQETSVRVLKAYGTVLVLPSGAHVRVYELSFPDGRRLTAHLDRAPLDLFVNVVREKALWVADNRVVGFPHYPVVATARFGNGT